MTTLFGSPQGVSPWIEKTLHSTISPSSKETHSPSSTKRTIRARIVQVQSTPPLGSKFKEYPPYFFIHDGFHKIAVFFSPSAISSNSPPPRYSVIKLLKYHISTLSLCIGRYSFDHPILQHLTSGLSIASHNTPSYESSKHPPILCIFASSIQVMEQGGSTMGLATMLPELKDANFSIIIRQALRGISKRELTKRILQAQDENDSNSRHDVFVKYIYMMNTSKRKINIDIDEPLELDKALRVLVNYLSREHRKNQNDLSNRSSNLMRKIINSVVWRCATTEAFRNPSKNDILQHFQMNNGTSQKTTSFDLLEKCFSSLLKAHPCLSFKAQYVYFREKILKPLLLPLICGLIHPLPSSDSLKIKCSEKERLQIVSDLYGRVENFYQMFTIIKTRQNVDLTPTKVNFIVEQTLDMMFRSVRVSTCLSWVLDEVEWNEKELLELKNIGLTPDNITTDSFIAKKIRVLLAQSDIEFRENIGRGNQVGDALQAGNTNEAMNKLRSDDSQRSPISTATSTGSTKLTNSEQQLETEMQAEIELETQPNIEFYHHFEEEMETLHNESQLQQSDYTTETPQKLSDSSPLQDSNKTQSKLIKDTQDKHVPADNEKESDHSKVNNRLDMVGISDMLISQESDESSEGDVNGGFFTQEEPKDSMLQDNEDTNDSVRNSILAIQNIDSSKNKSMTPPSENILKPPAIETKSVNNPETTKPLSSKTSCAIGENLTVFTNGLDNVCEEHFPTGNKAINENMEEIQIEKDCETQENSIDENMQLNQNSPLSKNENMEEKQIEKDCETQEGLIHKNVQLNQSSPLNKKKLCVPKSRKKLSVGRNLANLIRDLSRSEVYDSKNSNKKVNLDEKSSEKHEPRTSRTKRKRTLFSEALGRIIVSSDQRMKLGVSSNELKRAIKEPQNIINKNKTNEGNKFSNKSVSSNESKRAIKEPQNIITENDTNEGNRFSNENKSKKRQRRNREGAFKMAFSRVLLSSHQHLTSKK